MKNLIEYQAGVRGISNIRETREFGPGPRSTWKPKGKKNTTKIVKIPIKIFKSFFIIDSLKQGILVKNKIEISSNDFLCQIKNSESKIFPYLYA